MMNDNDGDEGGGKWIQGAVKHPGAFTAAAKKRGMSVGELAGAVTAHPENYSSTMVKRANFAKTMRGIANKLKKKA